MIDDCTAALAIDPQSMKARKCNRCTTPPLSPSLSAAGQRDKQSWCECVWFAQPLLHTEREREERACGLRLGGA